jgi:hypothetical protein
MTTSKPRSAAEVQAAHEAAREMGIRPGRPWPKGDAPDVLGEDGVIFGCAACGAPTETIPCADHQWARA